LKIRKEERKIKEKKEEPAGGKEKIERERKRKRKGRIKKNAVLRTGHLKKQIKKKRNPFPLCK